MVPFNQISGTCLTNHNLLLCLFRVHHVSWALLLCYAVKSGDAVWFSCLKMNVSALLLVKYSLHH
jgi:hypothetical protein